MGARAASAVHGKPAMEPWHPYPDVGLAELDREHRELGLALHETLRAVIADDRDRTLALGRELARRCVAHFEHEEALMKSIGYADAARHAKSHDDFIVEAGRRLDGLVESGLSADFLRWAGTLDQWFRRHVMTEDLWLALAVQRARATGLTLRK